MKKVFIDGSTGTTGLKIWQRLSQRKDIELLLIGGEKRHDLEKRAEMISKADLSFLCLPDEKAREIVDLIGEPPGKIIDTSTAHRTSRDWVYGMAELPDQREIIKTAKFIANPGCHASGFIALVAPLVRAGVIDENTFLACTSITGYSGGGKKMIAGYESEGRDEKFKSAGHYSLSQTHKHIPEMLKFSGLKTAPAFLPIVDDFFSGMQTVIPLPGINAGKKEVGEILADAYSGVIRYVELDGVSTIYSNNYAGKDSMAVFVSGNDERIVLGALFDNLGKGACGAAIQNMNIALDFDENEGLIL